MKLEYKPLQDDSLSSIHVRRITDPYIAGNWHFHEEYELIYFIEGHGTRIVGDHISNFKEGELVLVGGWLPHLWLNEVDDENHRTDFIVLKFRRDFRGVNLFSLPELLPLQSLLMASARGILFDLPVIPKVNDDLIALTETIHTEKLIHFLKVLQTLALEQSYQPLASPEFVLPSKGNTENRLQKVITYISENYSRAIPLDEIAGLAYMTPQAFCRFFKTRTNKTFSHFLNEVRVSKACQMLINGEQSIKAICYSVGFNSLTNFNRTFRLFKGESPRQYRSKYQRFRLAAEA